MLEAERDAGGTRSNQPSKVSTSARFSITPTSGKREANSPRGQGQRRCVFVSARGGGWAFCWGACSAWAEGGAAAAADLHVVAPPPRSGEVRQRTQTATRAAAGARRGEPAGNPARSARRDRAH